MKILWLTEFYPGKNKESMIGGVPTRCYYVGNYLAKRNTLEVIEGAPKKWAKPSLKTFLIRLLIYLPAAVLAGLKKNFDLVEASNGVMYFPAFLIAKLRGEKLVFWYPDVFLGSWVENVGVVGIIGEVVERINLSFNVDRFIAISQTVKNKLVRAGVSASKISVVYCGVDISQSDAIRAKKIKIKYDIVAVSRLVPYKRINDLIMATTILKKSHKSIKVAILGKGSELLRLQDLVGQLGLQTNVEFVDFLPSHAAVLSLISSGRIFCHPSIVEGFGIAPIEAMSLGKPVVAAKIPVIEEVTQNGKGSLLFEPQNVPELAACLEKLLSNENFYQKKRLEALNLARSYDWEKIALDTEKIYQEVAGG